MYQSTQFKPLSRSQLLAENISAPTAQQLEKTLKRDCNELRGFMLLANNKVVAEYFTPPYMPEDKVWVYSISKSFTSTAIGFAVREGLLELDNKVVDFYPDAEIDKTNKNLLHMRIRDLLTMTSGHKEDTIFRIIGEPNGEWERAFLNLSVEYEPGTHFTYNSGASFMLSSILHKVTQQGLIEYLTPRLFEPLGFDDVIWDKTFRQVETGGWGIKVRLEAGKQQYGSILCHKR